MRILIIIVYFFAFILYPSIAYSLDTSLEEHPRGDLGIEMGIETSYIKYREPDVMRQEGAMYGIRCALTYHGWLPPLAIENNRSMLKVDVRGSFGQVDYTSDSTGTLNNIDDYMLEFRGLMGYDFMIWENTSFTPYAGIGYRYLNDDSSGMTTSTGAKGYERESNYYYVPLGVEIMTPMQNGWSIGAILEYDYFLKGIQRSHLSDAVSSFNDLKNNQNDGYGCRGSIRLQKHNEKIDYIIEVFIRYWKIEKSDVSEISVSGVLWGHGWEPQNTSTEAGIDFSVQF